MLNQIVLVGRLVKNPEIRQTDTNKNVSNITLAIPRSFKNVEGKYDTDFIECTLWDNIAKNTAEYCQKGDIVGVKGRVQTRIIEKDDNSKEYRMDIVAEKVTFLSRVKEAPDQER